MKSILSPIALSLAFILQPVQAESEKDQSCNFILDGAQQIFYDLFPSNPKTQFSGSWCYRYYKESKIYAGINRGEKSFKTDGVYVLGGVFGDTPVYIDQADAVIDLLSSQISEGLCGNSGLPAGLMVKNEGNITTFSSGGECIKIPRSNNYCDTLPEKGEGGEIIATGIHALITTEISDYNLSGIKIPSIPDIFGFSKIKNPFEYLKDELNHSVCIINYPAKTDHIVETDICIDLSNQLGDIASFIKEKLPVTMKYKGLTNTEVVEKCHDTNAESISDLKTGEFWLRKNGEFVKVDK